MIRTTSRGQPQQFAKRPGTPGKSLNELAAELKTPEGWRSINEKLKALTTVRNDLEQRLENLKPSYRRYGSIARQLENVNREIENLMAALRMAVNMNRWSD